ncbi:hypothetical protein ACFYM7_01275 [Streptomyces cyaneofuscatus]|uniref:hypothetical protein n=1 Tax=Streptomyces cyaneofuscatus TaxID=66883 RepID=UPI0033D5ED16
MTRRARIIVWGASVLCVLVAAGLGALAVAGGLDRADKAASIVGAVIGLAGLVVSLYALHRSPAPGPVPPAPGPAPGPAAGTGSATVAEGVRSVAAGGSIGRAVTGDGVSLTGPAPVLPPSSGSGGGGAAGSARATGERSVAAGGDIGEAVTGDGPRA